MKLWVEMDEICEDLHDLDLLISPYRQVIGISTGSKE
jgi:hypothetical protein